MAILGIDEVGRGPWAGPLVIGAVVLPERFDQDGQPIRAEHWQDNLADSKQLKEAERKRLRKLIFNRAIATGLGWVTAAEIDEIGLMPALELATRRAVNNVFEQRTNKLMPESQKDTLDHLPDNLPFDEIIIDGTVNFLKDTPLEKFATTLVKADNCIKEVSAASIIAKVARDEYMKSIIGKYPGYGFEKHVGYGTPAHRAAIAELGPCPEHRYSIKPLAQRYHRTASNKSASAKNNTVFSSTTLGKRAETVVLNYLKEKGHTILARNYKTKYYEIDIVSATNEHIYFTEVKYRKSNTHGSPLEYIDQKKQKQITFAANAFMAFLSKELNRSIDDLPSPILAAAAVDGPDFTLAKWLPIVV